MNNRLVQLENEVQYANVTVEISEASRITKGMDRRKSYAKIVAHRRKQHFQSSLYGLGSTGDLLKTSSG